VGGSIIDAGIGFALFSIFTGLVVMIVGRTDFYLKHIKSMVFWGFLISGIGELTYIAVRTKWEIFIIQSLIGISVGLLNPAWDTIYTDNIEEGEGTKKWSFWTGGISFIIGISAITGSIILKYLGWNGLFIAMAGFNLPAIYYAYKIYKEK
jgi:hypothetical protein